MSFPVSAKVHDPEVEVEAVISHLADIQNSDTAAIRPGMELRQRVVGETCKPTKYSKDSKSARQ